MSTIQFIIKESGLRLATGKPQLTSSLKKTSQKVKLKFFAPTWPSQININQPIHAYGLWLNHNHGIILDLHKIR